MFCPNFTLDKPIFEYYICTKFSTKEGKSKMTKEVNQESKGLYQRLKEGNVDNGKDLEKAIIDDGLSKEVNKVIILPPLQGAEIDDELHPDVAKLNAIFPFDVSLIALLDVLYKNEPGTFTNQVEELKKRVRFYKRMLPSSFFAQIKFIFAKHLGEDSKEWLTEEELNGTP